MEGKYIYNRRRKQVEFMFFNPAEELRLVHCHDLVSHRTPTGESVLTCLFETRDKKQLITSELVPVTHLLELDYVRTLRDAELEEAERKLLVAERVVKLRLLVE